MLPELRNAPSKNVMSGRLAVMLLAGFMFLITILYIWQRFSIPVDGARLEMTRPIWKPEGILITKMDAPPSGLQSNDLVTGVDGISMATWAGRLFKFEGAPPMIAMDQVAQYSVLREGRALTIPVAYGPYSLKDLLEDRWGTLLYALVTQIVGTFVFIRRSNDPQARLLFAWSWLGSHTYAWSMGLQISDLITWSGFWLYSIFTPLAWLFYWSTALHFALIFPQPVPHLRKHPTSIYWVYLGAPLFFAAFITLARLRSTNLLEWLGSWSSGGYLVSLVYLGLMVAVMIWNFRHTSDQVSRQKIRWAVFGAFISGFGGLVLWNLPPILLGRQLISPNSLGILVTVFPLTLAIAILRHHLFDIDRIINRTLVYSALTGILAIVYLGMVVLLQTALHSITGEDSPLAVVASTLIISLLFFPLRSGIQKYIDRRFYRRKYDPQKVLEGFADRVRYEVELEQINGLLIEAVEQTVQPQQVDIWLRSPTTARGA